MGIRFQLKNCPRWNSHMNKTRTSMTEPQSFTLSPPLDHVLNLYFHRLESAMNCTGDIIAVGKNLVRNLKQDNNSDEAMIFHELLVLFPQHGCPLTLYTTKDRERPYDCPPIPECTSERGK